jgi:hypothetical protein
MVEIPLTKLLGRGLPGTRDSFARDLQRIAGGLRENFPERPAAARAAPARPPRGPRSNAPQ